MIGTSPQPFSSPNTRSHSHNLLNESTPLEQKPTQPLRTAFNHWIRSLPMEERFLAVKINAANIPTIIRKALVQLENPHNERSPQSQACKSDAADKGDQGAESKKTLRKLERGFHESLVLVSDGHAFLDHICFDFGLLECPQKLFDLLMATLDSSISRPMQEAIKSQRTIQAVSQILQQVSNRDDLIFEVLSFLRQQVLLRFRESILNGQFISTQLEEEKKRKKEFSIYWKYLPAEAKHRLLLLGHSSCETLSSWLKSERIALEPNDLQQQMQDLLKLQKNDFCNRIFKCKLKKSTQSIIDYYQLIYCQWKKEVQKLRKKRMMKHMRTERDYNSQQKVEHKESKQTNGKKHKQGKHRKSTSVQSNQTNQTQHDRILEKTLNYERKFQKDVAIQKEIKKETIKEESQEKIENCCGDKKQEESEQRIQKKIQSRKKGKGKFQQKNYNYSDKNQKVKTEKIKNQKNPQNYEKNQQYFQKAKKPNSISSSVSTKLSTKTISSQPPQKVQKPLISKSQLRQANLLRLDQQLQDLSDKISLQANEFHQRRVIAFERIQFLLHYYNIPIRLFGSCASGIAVKNSDIDIAIDNSLLSYMQFFPEGQRLKKSLQWLQQIFKSQACFTQIKLIKTAVIPVIKMTIDTSITFLDPSFGDHYCILNRSHSSGPLDADITVQTRNKSDQCSHVGIISTNAINQWLQSISSLHTIVIVMKQYFLKKKLNVTYGGGLNGFSMIVLLVAFIKHAKLEEETNTAVVFQKILKFYSEDFKEQQIGIDLLNQGKAGIFFQKLVNGDSQSSPKLNKQQHADLEIRDPMQHRKNMTRNCYLFTEVKKMFRQILQKCFTKSERQIQQISKGKISKGGKQFYGEAKQLLLGKNVFIDLLQAMQKVF